MMTDRFGLPIIPDHRIPPMPACGGELAFAVARQIESALMQAPVDMLDAREALDRWEASGRRRMDGYAAVGRADFDAGDVL